MGLHVSSPTPLPKQAAPMPSHKSTQMHTATSPSHSLTPPPPTLFSPTGSAPLPPLPSPKDDFSADTPPSASPSPLATAWARRRISWQRHLSPKLQHVLTSTARVMDGGVVLSVIVVSTLLAIFLEDIKAVFLLSLFALEVVINSVAKAGYFFSFFFWLDVVSVFSLLPDIPFMWNPMIGLRSSDSDTAEQQTDAAFEVERVRRMSRTGQRLLNLLKFVKLIRLGRIAKLFEVAQHQFQERARAKRRAARIEEEGEEDDGAIHASEHVESSQVGSELSEQTTRKVVVLVLLMMLGVPLLQPTTEEKAEQFVVGELNVMAGSPSLLGIIVAYRHPNGTLQPLDDDEEARIRESGGTDHLVELSGSTLTDMLVNYDVNLGQPLPLGDKFNTISPPFNLTYIRAVVPAANYSVALAALTQARYTMDQQFQWALSRFSSTILYLRIRGFYFANDFVQEELFQLRVNEMKAAEDPRGGGGKSFGIFSVRSAALRTAQFNMYRTLAVLGLLSLAAIAFNYNNQRMVIQPIERMVATIVQLQKNPLARTIHDKEGGNHVKEKESMGWETDMLERTLQKLTGLLQIGFGEAGARMIQKCMNVSGDGDLDPLVDGSRMLAIFGFCDIRRFTDSTECLREDVMMYVNEIASIVHHIASSCEGHPNKNVGDAFLVVWRMKQPGSTVMHLDADMLFYITERQPKVGGMTKRERQRREMLTSQAERDYAEEQERQRQEHFLMQRAKQAGASYPPSVRRVSPFIVAHLSVLADKAVISFLRTILELDASPELREYEKHPRIVAALKDFHVDLGFGLHCGWAIEGPIGSRYKIDASYLSPHVNLSEALQDLTKDYGTPLLMSGEFYSLLSPYVKSFLRRLDVLKLPGRDTPLNLYTFDLHPVARAHIIRGQLPPDYEEDEMIRVMDLKQSVFNWEKLQHLQFAEEEEEEEQEEAEAVAEEEEDPGELDDDQDPQLSEDEEEDAEAAAAHATATAPSSGAPRGRGQPNFSVALSDPLTHPLFSNPYLNPRSSDFACHRYSLSDREDMHHSSPIGTHHIVLQVQLSVLQVGIPQPFFDVYEEGLQLYLEGDWEQAKEKMEVAKQLYPEDKATQLLLTRMEEHHFHAPDDWPGWHQI